MAKIIEFKKHSNLNNKTLDEVVEGARKGLRILTFISIPPTKPAWEVCLSFTKR